MEENIRRESGSALFLILIAVVLFAALSYAVTQSGRSGGTIAKEQRELDLSRISQGTAAVMTYTIHRMKLVNNCKDNQFHFAGHLGGWKKYDGTWVIHTNPNAPADESCHVFSKNGGGMVPPPLTPLSLAPDPVVLNAVCPSCDHAQSWAVAGKTPVLGVGTDTGADPAGTELLLVRWVNKDACIALNKKFGITNPGGNPPVDNMGGGGNYDGTFTSSGLFDAAQVQGKHDFCAFPGGAWAGVYLYFHVLIAR